MKILVIEDEKDLSDFLKSGLEAESFAVDISKDGEEGLRMAKVNEYDLIVTDYIMPKMDGKEFCEKIRETKNVPIIMLSVKNEPKTKSEILDLGADDYLSKPFSFEELLSRIKAILRRPSAFESPIIKAGNLTMDVERHTLKYKEKEIGLTKKEFMILELLMRKAGKVVSRGLIMEHVWDINADPFSNSIETHILSIRKKIGLKNKDRVIRTIPGIGYKLIS